MIGVGVMRASIAVQLGRGGQRRLRAEPRRGKRAGGARPAERLLVRPLLEHREHERRGERVTGGGAVDRVDPRRRRARDLAPVLVENRALGAVA